MFDASEREPAPAPEPPRDWVAEIRALAAQAETESAVQVTPLAEPAVEDLKRAAAELENAQRYDEASAALEQAIGVLPEDPELWQWTAELALRRGDWAEAERRAQHAFDLGPKLGRLCVRNWLTVHASRIERGEPVNAESALAQLPGCTVKPVLRM